MAIDSGGQWWRGTEALDLDDYLVEYRAGGYPVDRVVHADWKIDYSPTAELFDRV